MVKAATVAGLLALTLHLACSPFGGANAFTCAQDTDCQGTGQGQGAGRCELSTGFCAFPDDACGPNGRYGSLSGGLSNDCVDGSTPTDAPTEPDGMPPDPDDVCFGATGATENPCWDPAEIPDQPLVLASGTIDTTSSNLCSTTVKNTTACVVAASTITLSGGITLRATGTKPLILVATTGTIQIDGVVDAASHVGVAVLGPSANFAGCDPGTAAITGGGGAGGSFGSQGGTGGDARNVVATGGTPGATQPPEAVRGGCPGQVGEGTAGIRGEPGAGGGAVYLIGKTGIGIGATGSINASGAGGINATISSQGGGGGGSGGMIVLDAPTITNLGSVFSNGGGGGEGAGQSNPGAVEDGGSGDDPTGIAAAAGGLDGTTNGGNGGAGGAAAGNGVNGSPGSAVGGGGGGGGGTGVIRVFGGGTLAGNRSPNPT